MIVINLLIIYHVVMNHKDVKKKKKYNLNIILKENIV